MPLTLKEFRQKYPQYNKVSDQKLAEALHRKYYSNVPFDEFATKVDYKVKAEEPPPTIEEPAPPAEKSDRSWYEVSGERLIKGLGTQIAEGAKQGLGGVSQAAVDALPNSIDQLPPGLSYEDVYRLGGVREYYAQVYGITSNEQLKQIKAQATQKITARRKASEARTAEATPEDLTLLESGLRGSAESIARNLPGIAASIATGNPIPALASAGLQTGAESYGQARAEGVTPAKAARFAGIDATIEIATELLPTKWLLGAVGANSLSGVKKELLKFAAGETTGEQLATLGQSINAYANDLDQELAQAQTLGEKAEIQGRRQALTAIATLVSSGTFAGGVGAAAKITDITRERAESKRVADELSRSTAIRALDPNTYDPTLISPAQTVRPPEIVSGEPAAPPSRPRPFLTPEVGTALEGLTATDLPPEVIDGVPPAVVDSARDILTLVDEGKSINLFRARSLAKQLGVDLPNNANKETTLTALREAVALVAAPALEVTSPKAAPAVEVAVDAPPVETARPKRVNPFLTPEALAQTEPVVAAPVATLTTPPEVVTPSGLTFTTAKGSTYAVNDDGTTTRSKAARPEQPGEEGLQPTSKRTVYVDKDGAEKLSEVQTQGGARKTLRFDDATNSVAVGYLDGEDAGKVESRTVTKFATDPAVGLTPVEYWGDNKTVHFGNEITKVTPPEASRGTEPVTSEVVGGAGARGAELPVSRVPARGQGPAGAGVEGLGVPNVPAARVDEREGVTESALEPAKTKLSARDQYLSEVQNVAKTLESGDVIVTDTGDRFLVSDVLRNKNGDVFAITTPKEGGQGYSTLDIDGLGALFTPQSYIDTNTGERRISRPATIEKSTLTALPTPSKSTTHPEWATTFESDVGGEVVYSDADTALVRGSSAISGQSVYVAVDRKTGRRTGIDIESYTGSMFSPEQKQRLVQAKQQIITEDKAKFDANPDGPFTEATSNVVASDGVNPNYANFLSSLMGSMGLGDIRVFLFHPKDVVNKDKYRLYGPYSSALSAGLDYREDGSLRLYGPNLKDFYISVKPGMSEGRTIEVITHELGHLIERVTFNNASPETQAAIRADHDKWLKDNKGKQGSDLVRALRNRETAEAQAEGITSDTKLSDYYWRSFGEWFADNVSKWATTSKKPVGIVEKFFSDLAKKLRELVVKLTGNRFAPAKSVKDFLDAMGPGSAESWIQDKTVTTSPAYRSIQPPKNLLQVRKAGAKAKKPSLLQRAAQQFEGHNFYKNLVRKFADTTEPIMALDRDKKRSGFLITLGPDRNDIASELVRSPNIADFIIRRRIEHAERRLQQYIKNYARVMGIKPEDAVDKLDSILIAIHEPVRRETKYLRNVGLRNDIRLPAANLPFAAGQPDMTPADYREYLEGLRSKVPPDQAAEIQDVMRVVVDKFKTSRGFSPKAIPGKPTPLDINDKFYDVIPRKIDGKDAYTPQLLRTELDEYRSLTGKQKTTVDDVRTALTEINELERQLSQEANYWPPQVDSIIASYQWGDTYVPFQGIPDADDSLDYSSKKLSGELTEATQAWDGRSTDFDSPILQSIYNAKRAAGRVSRKDLVSVTIVNNIKQGFLRAKSIDPKVYTFDNRRAPDFDFSVLQGREKVLDYQPNGDVHVYELKQDDKIDALKKAYKELHPWLEPVSTLTSWIAQYHTRFNPAFAPMDFFTNTFSNLGFITAGEGGVREGGRYLAQTLSNVARSGLFLKTANISRVLSAKNPAALNKLLQSNDSFYQDAMDFISRGGLSLQRQALGIDVQREKLVNAVGPGLFIKTNEQAARLFDIYNDMFELTSRLAAYTAHLKDITARAKLKKIDVNIPEVQEALKREATTFALELMNFSKMGEYGRTLSAVYMFFKPGATSAKLAYDAVRKAIISADSALKNADPAVWARLNSVYELQELQEEQAKPRPDQQKITELQNAITANEEAKQKFINNYNMEKKNAAIAIPLFFAAGAIYYSIAQMFSPDDDEGRNKIATDEMSRWTRYARMPMPGQKEFFQLPWGYGVGAFAAAGAQTEALRQGNLSFSDYASNMIEIGLDSFMPFPASRTNPFDNVGAWIIGTIAPSAARGFLEYTFNLDSLGNPIYNSRLGKYADAYSGTARAGELHNAMADVLFGISEGNINWNPNTIAYMLNTYADGPNVIAESSFNIALRLRDEKDADLKKDIPVFKRFVGRMSNFDAQEFSEAERWIREKAPIYKTFRDIRPPEEYDRYVEKHPTVPVISAMYDNVLNGALSTLSEQRKLIQRNRELTPKERTEYLDDIDYNINATKRNFVESYRAIREEEDAGS